MLGHGKLLERAGKLLIIRTRDDELDVQLRVGLRYLGAPPQKLPGAVKLAYEGFYLSLF